MQAQEQGNLSSIAINKALEQKLIGPLEESHTEEQPPKHFCERSFELGDRKWQQDKLEHGFELWDDFFLEEDEVCGCWNKWRGPRGFHEVGGAPSTLVARCLPPCCVLSARYSQIF